MERIALVGLLALLTYLVYLVFAPFLVPLIWAVVLVVFCFPLHARVRRLIRRPALAALASTAVLTVVSIGPVLLVTAAFVNQAVEGARWVQGELREGRRPVLDTVKGLPLTSLLERLPVRVEMDDIRAYTVEMLQKLSRWLAEQAGQTARAVVSLVIDLLIMLVAVFYLFRDGPAIVLWLGDALPMDAEHRDRLLAIVHDTLHASLFSSFVVAALQGGLGGVTFWALGLAAPVLWGTVMALLAFLPMVGSWLVWVPAAAYLFFDGRWIRALVLVAIGALVIGTVDNVLRPILIGGRVPLNGLVLLISVLGGVTVFGMVGIVLGPVLVALGAAVIEVQRANRIRLSAAG